MYHAPQSDGDGTARWQAASLSHAQIVVEPNDAPPRDTGLATRLAQWRADTVARIAATDIAPDLAPDLAEAIGSRRWFRGAGTILALMAGALALWPDFAPLEAAASLSADDTENARIHDEYRSQMIMPLALGGDTGRRMGATPQVIALRSAPERPQIDVVATLSQGDSFDRMLQRAGVGHADAARVAQLVARTIPIDGIEPGTQVDITLGRRTAPGVPRPLDNLHFRARFDLALKLERTNGTLALRRLPIRVDDTPLRIRGKVGGSLYRSARAAGAPASAVQQFLETLGDHVDLDRSVGAQDAFDIIIAHRRAETGERLAGKLLYAGIVRGGKPRTQLMRWGSKGEFFEASGIGEQRSGLMAPVPGAVSSRYGMRRHPILGYRRMHAGLDFKAGRGTPIVAVTDGRVTGAGRMGGCGNAVRLNHTGGLATRYCHMSQIAVRGGQSVRRGQVIGYVGSTGLSTGPHLHYEMYSNGRSIDPASVKFVTRAQLSGAELADFRESLRRLQQIKTGAALKSLAPAIAVENRPLREIDRLQTSKPST
ncbi:MAG: M23 family metallopeptidase [Pontixanthobacter sp.]